MYHLLIFDTFYLQKDKELYLETNLIKIGINDCRMAS